VDCGFTDVGCMAQQAINGWFRELVRSGANSVLSFLSTTVLGTPEIGSPEMDRAEEIWGTSQKIANTCFVLLITIAGVTLMAGQSLPGELAVKDLLPRVLVAFLCANLSLVLVGYCISFANGLAEAFLSAGHNSVDPKQVGVVIANGVLATIATQGLFYILISLVVVVLAVCVAFIYVMRLAITMVLIAAAPIALMFHALPMTEGIARLWWRGMVGMLAIQVCQALVFVTALQLLLAGDSAEVGQQWAIPPDKSDLIDLLLIIGLLMVMIRIPSWVARTIWQPAQPRMLGQLFRSLVVYRTIGGLANALGNGRGARFRWTAGSGAGPGGRGGRGRPHGPGPGSPSGGGPQNPSGGNGPRGGRRAGNSRDPHRRPNAHRGGRHANPHPSDPRRGQRDDRSHRRAGDRSTHAAHPGFDAFRRNPAASRRPRSTTGSHSRQSTFAHGTRHLRSQGPGTPHVRASSPTRQATVRLVPPRRRGGRR
jgi:hypothetical protein